MKKHLLLSIFSLLFIFQTILAQVYDDSFNPVAESIKLAPIPNSPEAQAFTKYGNTPVNMYTGTPTVQVPIFTFKGRELNLPISLSYDASGVKVEQLATQVGLSWNLNVGGRVSRITNGLPDDFYLSNYTLGPYKSLWDEYVRLKILNYRDLSSSPTFSTQDSLLQYMRFLKKTNDNEYDIQPDYFSFSALGQSDMFVIDLDTKIPKALNNPRIKVSCNKPFPGANSPIENWVVTMDDGVKYTFEEAEVTRDVNLNDFSYQNIFFGFKKEYNSSWLLKKIESPNGKDIYEFVYHTFDFWDNVRNAGSISAVTNPLQCDTPNSGHSSPSPSLSVGYSNSRYTIKQKVLEEIKHNGKRIVSVDLLAKRWDLDINSAIERINIYSDDTNSPADLYKSYTFNYDYFRTDFVSAPPYSENNPPDPLFLRLKLDGITIKDKNDTSIQNYHFDYIEPYKLPSTTSMAQDYYGYANGATTNTVLYPKFIHPCVFSFDGANRGVNFNMAKRGLLNKLSYPTGGYTEFEYEQNKEKEATGTSTSWVSVSSLQIDYPTLPPFDSNACNASFLIGNETPSVSNSAFEVTKNQTDYKIIYNQIGTLKKGFDVEHMASLVKIPDPNNLLSWTDIYDNNCSVKAGVEVVWTRSVVWVSGQTPLYPSTHIIKLDKGFYQLVLANPSATLSNSLEVKEGVVEMTYTYNNKAGIRVKSIKDFTDTDVLAIHKTYSYPSGTVISNPKYTYTSEQYIADNGGDISPTTILHRLSKASGTDKPHIGYAEVIETIVDNINSESNGNTSQRFYTNNAGNYRTGVYTYYINGKETVNNYSVAYELGKPLSTTTYNSAGVKTSNSQSSYYDLEYYQNKAPYLNIDESKSELYPIPTLNSTGIGWSIAYIDPVKVPTNSGGTISLVQPPECNTVNFLNDLNVTDLCKPSIARLVKRTTNAWGKVGNIRQSVSKQYFDNEAKTIQQTTNYSYYDEPIISIPFPNKPPVTTLPNYLLKETSTINSLGDTLKRELKYPDGGSLIAKNMLNTIVQSNVYKNDALISTKKTIYNGTLPDKIQIAKGTQNLEDRLFFERYEQNNLVQVRQVDGKSTAYIWGYNQQYPVAKIEDATYSLVESMINISNLQNLSNQDTDRTKNSDGQEGILRDALNNLRTQISNAQVTTYTYDPLIGVTSITDPRGYTIYYEYDDFNRLTLVKDAEGNILSKNEYHYKN